MNKTILFITSCCFSDCNSNGKTLEELFSQYPKENIAQFFVKSFQPDWDFCDNYFNVTDKDMLTCFVKRSGGEMTRTIEAKQLTDYTSDKIIKKDAFRLMIRQMLWNTNIWMKRTGFLAWVDRIMPDVVFYMVGENSFMMNIAIKVAEFKNIPLIVFNTEGYYFAKKNYFPKASCLGRICFPFFIKRYKKNFERMMSKAAYVAYLCPKLQKDYGKVFDTPSEILYAPSRIRVSDYLPKRSGKDMVISYLGSLTLGRHKSLMQIGEFLYGYNSSLRLRVYGRADDDVESELRSAKGIEYRGQIPYTKVVEEIGNSDILIHVESFDPFFKDMILYGFTTKIADSLMSGRCFFVYAPDYVACSEYIYSINPECVANNLQEMMIKLSALLDNPELRSACVENFKRYALLNHHPTVNYKKIKKIISVVTHQNT